MTQKMQPLVDVPGIALVAFQPGYAAEICGSGAAGPISATVTFDISLQIVPNVLQGARAGSDVERSITLLAGNDRNRLEE